NFYHYLFVASTAADEARKDGFSQEEANIILIASLFHDLFRSSSEVTDKFGEGLSIQLLDEFCRAQNVPEKERKAMIEALEHSKPFQSETASVISRYLQFADFVHFLDPARISSFIIEFLNYHETPLEQIGDIYADKFTRKFKDMSPEIKAKVIDFVQKASDGAISDPIVHAMQVFRKYPFISPPSAENSPEYDSQRLQFGGMPNSLRYNALVNLRELIEMIKDQDENLAHEMNLIFFRRLNEYAIKIPPYLTPLERDAFHHIATRGIRDRSA
ncbi:MAG: hypothetical protein KGI71_04485, partial [Patescibacteria group bacterium]|nr:hypothetical protein [Patescibacteria group bacterium]